MTNFTNPSEVNEVGSNRSNRSAKERRGKEKETSSIVLCVKKKLHTNRCSRACSGLMLNIAKSAESCEEATNLLNV